MKEIALDTNIVIEYLNGEKLVMQKVDEFNSLYLPVTVLGELLFGAKNSQKKAFNIEKTLSFTDSCVELDVTSLVAEEYSNIRLSLKKKGRPIPENDIWIAAICKTDGLTLMTKDKHFENIDGLKLYKL